MENFTISSPFGRPSASQVRQTQHHHQNIPILGLNPGLAGLVFSAELHCLLHHAINLSLRQAVHLVGDVDLLGLACGLVYCAHVKDATCGHQPMDKGLTSNNSKP